MADVCEKCGKKVGMLATKLEFTNGQVLCEECAKPIIDDLNALLYYILCPSALRTVDDYYKLKNTFFEKCKELYNENIQQMIAGLISSKYEKSNLKYRLYEEEKKRHKLTTGPMFSGYEIKEYIGVFSGQAVLGAGFLSDLSASFADTFGTESNKFADKLEGAKNAAVDRLIMKSYENGGNAIIGVNFNYITFSDNMIGVVANGTSVVIERIDNRKTHNESVS